MLDRFGPIAASQFKPDTSIWVSGFEVKQPLALTKNSGLSWQKAAGRLLVALECADFWIQQVFS